MGNLCNFPPGKPAATVTPPNLQCMQVLFLCFHNPLNSNMECLKCVCNLFACIYIHMAGPQLMVSAEGRLWGRESAQNFDSGQTHPQSAHKA